MKKEKGSHFQRACYVWNQLVKFILACGALIRCVEVVRKVWAIALFLLPALYPIIITWWTSLF